MLAGEVLIGGEVGGVGFGMHLPERDALFAAMLVLEALVQGGQPLGARMEALRQRCGGASHYDRLDLRLADMKSVAARSFWPPHRLRRSQACRCRR